MHISFGNCIVANKILLAEREGSAILASLRKTLIDIVHLTGVFPAIHQFSTDVTILKTKQQDDNNMHPQG